MKRELGPVIGDEFTTKEDVDAQAAAAGDGKTASAASGSSEEVGKVEEEKPVVEGKKVVA